MCVENYGENEIHFFQVLLTILGNNLNNMVLSMTYCESLLSTSLLHVKIGASREGGVALFPRA